MKNIYKTKYFLILATLLLVVSIGAIFYAPVSQTYYYHLSEKKMYYTVALTSRFSCDLSNGYKYKYITTKVLGNYKQKVNVILISNDNTLESIQRNNQFTHENIYRWGMQGNQKLYSIDSELPPQIKCDGSLDCDYGFTKKEWILKDKKCIIKPAKINIFRLENNKCNKYNIEISNELKTDYNTLQECQNNIRYNQTFYRFNNNTCNAISLIEGTQTNNDYNTLQECQNNIIKPTIINTTISEPIIVNTTTTLNIVNSTLAEPINKETSNNIYVFTYMGLILLFIILSLYLGRKSKKK